MQTISLVRDMEKAEAIIEIVLALHKCSSSQKLLNTNPPPGYNSPHDDEGGGYSVSGTPFWTFHKLPPVEKSNSQCVLMDMDIYSFNSNYPQFKR